MNRWFIGLALTVLLVVGAVAAGAMVPTRRALAQRVMLWHSEPCWVTEAEQYAGECGDGCIAVRCSGERTYLIAPQLSCSESSMCSLVGGPACWAVLGTPDLTPNRTPPHSSTR